MRKMKRWAPASVIIISLVAGLAIRWALRGYVSNDASVYLLPWYEFARAHGAGALRYPFTDYTPYYSYVLLGLTRLGGLAPPLTLIKAVSTIFELGCAVMAAGVVRTAGGGRWARALAFAGVWLAPTVLLNGPYWAQADSLWTFFILLSLMLFLRGRNGVIAFAFAFAVKLQSIFFAPFMLGMIFKRRRLWPWLAVIPAVYMLLAAPVLLAGRPILGVLSIYLNQAGAFHYLSVNAANLWIFWPFGETVGVIVGSALAALAGLFLAVSTMRTPPEDREGLLVAACASLLIMPFLLPKMHDRYFYAFEVASITLACVNPRYLGLAVIAQADGILSYMILDERLPLGTLAPAAFCNAGMAALLVEQMVRRRRGAGLSWPHLAAFVAAACLTLGVLRIYPGRGGPWVAVLATAFSFAGLLLLSSIRQVGSDAVARETS
jgi:Gpi18-like mannosyltransferase